MYCLTLLANILGREFSGYRLYLKFIVLDISGNIVSICIMSDFETILFVCKNLFSHIFLSLIVHLGHAFFFRLYLYHPCHDWLAGLCWSTLLKIRRAQ